VKKFLINLIGLAIILALVLSPLGIFMIMFGSSVVDQNTQFSAEIQEIKYFNSSATTDYDITSNGANADGYFIILKMGIKGFSSPWWNYKVYLKLKEDAVVPNGATIYNGDVLIPNKDYQPSSGDKVIYNPHLNTINIAQ